MAFSNSGFSKPQRSQKGSRLMQLPAEIRVKILRSLLKANESIVPFYNGSSDLTWGHQRDLVKYKDNTQLSAQVMRACQKLHGEAQHILYAENTLDIQILPRSRNEMHCSLLSYRSIIPGIVDKLGKMKNDLFSAEYPLMYLPRNGTNLRSATDLEICADKVFGAYKVRLDVVNGLQQQNVYVVCRLLRNLLYGKRVKIIFPHADLWKVKSVLGGCKILRCQSIEFHGIKAHQTLSDLITSDEPRENTTYDTIDRYFSFLTTFVNKLPVVAHQQFAKANRTIMDSLLDCTMSYDDAGFTKAQKVVMQVAMKWNQQWQAAEEEFSRKRMEQIKSNVLEANASIEAMVASGRRKPSLVHVSSKLD